MTGLIAAAMLAAIPFRGVVEGYYGRPWGTEGRISLMEFMGKEDMNVFIYGPKDDPYHHSKWREEYPAEQMADFKKLLAVAKKNKVNFYWAIHLGGTFSNGERKQADFASLFNKLEKMYAGGFRSFAVFFDDFGGADASFHAEICNRIVKEFLEKKGDCSPLIVCPNVYWGSGHPYHKTLGAELDKRAHIMWTGRGICSDVRAEDVARITADFQRPPFIWWNWPVNDYCRRKVLLGRTYGCDNVEYSGFVSNPMENCEANKIALHGIAEWCKDPEHFDSQKSWEEGFEKIYSDKEIAAAMRVFAEHNSDQDRNGHGYRREESVSALPLIEKANTEFNSTGTLNEATAKELSALFKHVGKNTRTLIAKLPKFDKNLYWEIEGWLKDEELLMAEGLCALELIKDGAKPEKAKKDIEKLRGIRVKIAENVANHIKKFQDATFPNDRQHCKAPEASSTHLRPLVENMLKNVLMARYQARTGVSFAAAGGFKAFSTVKSLPTLTVNRNGMYAGLDRVMERREVKPGEYFGLSVPESWDTNYFHARLVENDVSAKGIIEVSKDGSNWQKLETRNNGGEMQLAFNPREHWRHARYRNTANSPVFVKIEQFKFDVAGESSPIDELLKEEK